MAFYLSPIVNTIEKDLSLFIPAVATSIAAHVGDFQWGPIGEDILVSSTDDVLRNFGEPTDRNYKDWFSCHNFLAYSNSLRIARTANTIGSSEVAPVWTDESIGGGYDEGEQVVPTDTETFPFVFEAIVEGNSDSTEPDWTSATGLGDTIVDGDVTWVNVGSAFGRPQNASTVDLSPEIEDVKVIKNQEDWDILEGTLFGVEAPFIAKWPGKYGNRISVAWRDGRNYTPPDHLTTQAYDVGDVVVPTDTTETPFRFKAITAGTTGAAEPTWNTTGTTTDGTVVWQVAGPAEATWRSWDYAGLFQYRPETQAGVRDELAVVVLFDDVVQEVFVVDCVPGRTDTDGRPNFAGNVINRESRFVWFNHEFVLNNFDSGTTELSSENYGDVTSFGFGLDGTVPDQGDYQQVWDDAFGDAEEVDINLLITGGAPGDVGRYVIQNIAERRKDCVAFVSPAETDVVRNPNPLQALIDRRTGSGISNLNLSSSYGFMDTNYKYQYDRWNDKLRWLPLNGDMAGLAAATDNITDPWWSFAGFNRGLIKNVQKLAWNPNLAQRDDLYQLSMNPVITSRGEGSLLYGDRTMLLRPSAFRAVNVRRLFIVLAKASATAAKYKLFEFNDEQTRRSFVQMITPFLRDVQGRRGIQLDRPGKPGFMVVADERVNTDEVIDRQEFKAIILIRPNRSINFIELQFVATRSGTIFEEVIPEFDPGSNV